MTIATHPKTCTREYTLDTAPEGDRLEFSFSSEFPVERGWGTEILSHDSGAIDFSLMRGAPFLWQHDSNQILGVIEEVRLENRKGRCVVRWAKCEEAQERRQLVEDKILTRVSVGYEILEIKETPQTREIRVTKWRPYEISLVSIPADHTVGVGRSRDASRDSVEEISEGEDKMGEEMEPKELEVRENPQDLIKAERVRISTVRALCKQHGMPELGDKFAEDGTPIEEARKVVLEEIQKRGNRQNPIAQPLGEIGLDPKEKREYSFLRAIRHKMGQATADEAGLEIEVSRTIAERIKKPARGFYVPVNDLDWKPRKAQRDTFYTGASAQGGALIDTQLMGSMYIEALRHKMVMGRLGATMLSGLRDNVDIPRQSAVASVVWLAEGATIPQSEGEFELVTLRPKDIAGRSVITRRMLLQDSVGIEQIARNDLVKAIALGIDVAAIAGTGTSNQPTGILNYSGVNSVAIGANGGAVTRQHVIDLETEVAVDDADDGTCYYLTNARLKGALKQSEVSVGSGRWLWENGANGMGEVNGYGALSSNQVPSNLTKGSGTSLSALIFGDFSNVYIGEWGVLDVMVNPYGAGFEEGNVQVRAIQTVDVQLRRPQYFAVISDATTT